jgi:quinol monooxygenase YgiN
MEARIAIVAYKPKEGKSEELQQLTREHVSILRQQDLVTNRHSIMMRAKDDTIIEIFEWKSKAAIEQAHTNPEVLKMWAKYAEVFDYIPIAKVEEASEVFSGFSPFD